MFLTAEKFKNPKMDFTISLIINFVVILALYAGIIYNAGGHLRKRRAANPSNRQPTPNQ